MDGGELHHQKGVFECLALDLVPSPMQKTRQSCKSENKDEHDTRTPLLMETYGDAQ